MTPELPFRLRNKRPKTAKALSYAGRLLLEEFEQQIKHLRRMPGNPDRFRALASAISMLAQTNKALESLSGENADVATIRACLTDQTGRLDEARRNLPQDQPRAAAVLARSQGVLLEAAAQLPSPIPLAQCPSVIVPTDLLHEAYGELFPAERMVVVAGRRTDGEIQLGAVFDVTGSSSSGHVHSEPDRLATALIAMEKTDTHLAAWMHSHPGGGPAATAGSAIDERQHADWLRHFSRDLLCAIFVSDRYVRFLGTALENAQVQLCLYGSGVKRISDAEHIYLLD